jgi:hypothetical protein
MPMGCLCNVRHKVVRDAIWILTDEFALMSTNWIKVTKEYHVPLRISLLDVHQYLFEHRLCPTARISASALWTILCDRNDKRITINCSRATEDYILATMLMLHVNEHEHAFHVVLVILQWFCH